jgi:outer membrane protein TolC
MNGYAGVRFEEASPGGSARSRAPGGPVQRHTGATIGMVTLLALGLSGSVSADETPLTLAEAQRIAALRSERIEASDLGVSASKDLAKAAAERPDPVAKIGLENVPVNGSEAFSLQQDFMTMRSVGIMQEITRPSKLRARAAESEQAVRLAEAKKVQALVEVRRDSALAWLERYYAEATHSTITEQVESARVEVAAAEAAYRGGRGTAADVLAAREAMAEFEDQALEASRAVRTSRIALARWVGDAAERRLAGEPAIDTIPLHKHALDTQLQDHPEVVALERREELARAGAEVARAERHADWSVEFIYSARGTGYRQDPKLAAKLAEASQAKAEREDMLREHAADIAAAIDAWESTRERRNRYRTTIVPLAADRTVAARTAYEGGKASLNDLLSAHRAEIDARLKALELEATAARLWAQLAFLSPPPDSMPPSPRPTSGADGDLP